MGDMVEVEMVGGPIDGQLFKIQRGQFFLYLDHNGKDCIYGMGDDGKYHYCAEIPQEPEQ